MPFLRSNVRFSPLSVPGTWLRTATAMMRFPVSTVDPPASAPCWMPRSLDARDLQRRGRRLGGGQPELAAQVDIRFADAVGIERDQLVAGGRRDRVGDIRGLPALGVVFVGDDDAALATSSVARCVTAAPWRWRAQHGGGLSRGGLVAFRSPPYKVFIASRNGWIDGLTASR